MARKANDPRAVQRVRMIILVGLGLLGVAVLAAGLWSAVQPAPAQPQQGEHYATIDNAPPARGPVTVTEFFSYGCIHCRRFEPQLTAWRAELPEAVRFQRVPVVFSGAWRALAQAFYAMRELDILERNHERLFEAIHDQGRTLASAEAIAEVVGGHGIDAQSFLRAMGAPSVQRQVENARGRARRLGIRAVPTLVVDGRYRIAAGDLSRRQMLAVAEQMIARARKLR